MPTARSSPISRARSKTEGEVGDAQEGDDDREQQEHVHHHEDQVQLALEVGLVLVAVLQLDLRVGLEHTVDRGTGLLGGDALRRPGRD